MAVTTLHVTIMHKVNQEYGYQCVTLIYFTMVYNTSECHETVARDYRETSFVSVISLCMYTCYAAVILSTTHMWVDNYVCFKGQ